MKYEINIKEIKDIEIIARHELFSATPWYKNYIVNFAVPGVYILYYRGDIIYIGKSKNIVRRLYQHRKKAVNWDAFSYIEINDAFDRTISEAVYIRIYKPIINIDMLVT